MALTLQSQAPSLGATQGMTSDAIPWEQILANRRQITPEELFSALLEYTQQRRGGARRGMSGFIQQPAESAQIAEENAAFRARFPEDRQAQAISREQAAFGTRLPTFTQQEMANRAMTPQERINQRMGPGWATMDPTQRRTALQRITGQTPDFVNPLTGLGPTSPQVTAGGPSMINGMPAQQAIAQATQQANASQAVAGRRAEARQEGERAKFRKRNPKIARDIRADVYKMF